MNDLVSRMSSDESSSEESVIREDFMVKRSLMKGRIIQYDNFRARWIRLTNLHLKWLEGSLEVREARLDG